MSAACRRRSVRRGGEEKHSPEELAARATTNHLLAVAERTANAHQSQRHRHRLGVREKVGESLEWSRPLTLTSAKERRRPTWDSCNADVHPKAGCLYLSLSLARGTHKGREKVDSTGSSVSVAAHTHADGIRQTKRRVTGLRQVGWLRNIQKDTERRDTRRRSR